MYPWLSRATLIDIISSFLTRKEARLLLEFMRRESPFFA